jgi:hypothetical protein
MTVVCATISRSSSRVDHGEKYNAYRGSDNAIINAARMLEAYTVTLW